MIKVSQERGETIVRTTLYAGKWPMVTIPEGVNTVIFLLPSGNPAKVLGASKVGDMDLIPTVPKRLPRVDFADVPEGWPSRVTLGLEGAAWAEIAWVVPAPNNQTGR